VGGINRFSVIFLSLLLSGPIVPTHAETGGFPGLNLYISPYTVSPHTSSGASIGIGMSPQRSRTSGLQVVGDLRMVANFPYDRGGTINETDLLMSFGILFYIYGPILAGVRVGAASNQGISALPTPFYGGTVRGYLTGGIFTEGTLALSGAGFNYTQLAIGLHIL